MTEDKSSETAQLPKRVPWLDRIKSRVGLTSSEKGSQVEVDKLVNKIGDIFSRFPLVYKRDAFDSQFILLFTNVKAVIDYSLLGDTYSETDFRTYTEVLKKYGYKITDPIVQDVNNSYKRRLGYIYNPSLLKEQTKLTELAPPYISGDLLKYIEDAKKSGYKIGAICGKMYSFPESAIRDFLSVQDKGGKEKTSTVDGGETYFYFPPMQPDVVKREKLKNYIFDELGKSQIFQSLLDNPDYKKSNEEFYRRLPERFQIK